MASNFFYYGFIWCIAHLGKIIAIKFLKELTRLLLSALIKDITNKTQNKDKKAKGGVLYRGKPNKKGK